MKVSVIIPIYNKARYLQTILTQLRNQNFRDFECLLVDDGSKDGSGEICDRVATEDERFHVFHIPNGGVSNARNFGMNHARGTYITFLDADDEIDSGYLQSMSEKLDSTCADMIIVSSSKFWDDDRKEEIMVPYSGLVSSSTYLAEFARNQYATGIYGYCWGKMIRRALLKEISFDSKIRLAEDLDFYLRLYPQIKNIYFDTSILHKYRQEAENSSMLSEDHDIDYISQLKIQLKMYNMLEKCGYLNEENQILITKRIYDYVFFALFHTRPKQLSERVKEIRQLRLPSPDDFSKRTWRQRIMLDMFVKRKDNCLILYSGIYRMVRGR